MQEETAVLTYKLAIALIGGASLYFLMLWLMSKYIPDFSKEDQEELNNKGEGK